MQIQEHVEWKAEFRGIWIPREIYLNKNLSIFDKLIFTEISSLSNLSNGCFASNSYFAEFCQCSERQVSKSINKLKDLGYIEQFAFDGRKRFLKTNLECLANPIKSDISESDSHFVLGTVESNASLDRNICDSDQNKVLTINTYNNIENKIENNTVYENSEEFSQGEIQEEKNSNITKESNKGATTSIVENTNSDEEILEDGNTSATTDVVEKTVNGAFPSSKEYNHKDTVPETKEIDKNEIGGVKREETLSKEEAQENREKRVKAVEKARETKRAGIHNKISKGLAKLVYDYTENETLRDMLFRFIENCQESKGDKSITRARFKTLLESLTELSNDDMLKKIKLVRYNVERGYGAFYSPFKDVAELDDSNKVEEVEIVESSSVEDNLEDIPDNWDEYKF